jgi:hypothetical protein
MPEELTVRAHLTKYKTQQVRGQHANTRARSLLNKAETRTDAIAKKYRAARAAYLMLTGHGDWENTLKPLQQQDIRPLSAPEEVGERMQGDGLGEGHRTLSWIWISAGAAESDLPDMHEGEFDFLLVCNVLTAYKYNKALRVEWARSRARMQRWAEEIELLQEEMRRTLAYLEYRAVWWDNRCTLRTNTVFLDVRDGIRAYAAKQSAILRCRAKGFKKLWEGPRVVGSKESKTNGEDGAGLDSDSEDDE